MPSSQKTFRVFVSSTFTDFRAERRILQQDVFPKLKALCESKGGSFQAIDLRWGVNEEAQLDHKTMDICLNEIHRCQKLSPKPNFIILLGDRYGWQPVPNKIPSSEMKKIRGVLEKDDLAFVDKWYGEEDKNAIPPEYVLQPRGNEYEDYSKWELIEDKLRETLRRAVEGLNFTDEQKVKHFTSATHQEIIRGALNPPEGAIDPREHVFAYIRTIRNLPETIEAKDFIDRKGNIRDSYAKAQLDSIRKDLIKRLPDKHIYGYEAEWKTLDSPAKQENENPQTANRLNNPDIEAFAERVYTDLKTIIEAQLAEISNDTPEVKEIKLHEEFMQKRLKHFTGRDNALQAISKYLEGNTGKVLSIIGKSGTGKTSIMAKAIEDAKDRHFDPIFRFIGTTSNTSDSFKLLSQIIKQITEQYGVDMNSLLKEGEDEKKFGSLYGLKELFSRCLNLADSEKPLTIFLDALDQLSADLSTLPLDWLPKELPENVKMIVSTLPALKDKLSHTDVYEITSMEEKEGEELLDKWLGSERRTLSDTQKKEVISKFISDGTPLYLRLAFEKTKNWRSYTTVETLKEDIEGMLGEFFDNLQKNHDGLIVEKFCGYVLSGKYQGLTENELLGLFVFDKEYWDYFVTKRCHKDHREEVKEIGKLPVVVWSRLFLDLEPYLTEKDADGIPIISFYHRKFIEFARMRYLDNASSPVVIPAEAGIQASSEFHNPPGFAIPSYLKRGKGELLYHQTLADYFNQKEPLYLDDKEKMPNVRKVVEQPYQNTKAKDIEGIESVLTGLEFIEAKSRAGLTYELSSDYINAIALEIEWKDSKRVEEFHLFLKKEMNVLSQYPELTFQQAMNQPDKSAPYRAADLLWTSGKRKKPWLKWVNRPRYMHPCTMTFKGHTDHVNSCAISPDGKHIVSASSDKTLKIWDMDTGLELATMNGHTDDVDSCAISPDGKRIVSASRDKTLKVWDMKTGVELATLTGHTDHVNSCAISPDGKYIISVLDYDGVKVWDMETGVELATMNGHTDDVKSCAVSPDGKCIVLASRDKTLKVWDMKTGVELATLTGHTDHVNSCAISPDGKCIVSASRDKTLKVWDMKTGVELATLTGHTDHVKYCAISPDGKCIVSASWDNTLKVWDMETGVELATLTGHTDRVNSCAISPDGKYIISVLNYDSLKVWDMKTGVELATLRGHTNIVNSVAISPDGNRVVSASWDKTLKVWDMEIGTELATQKCHASDVVSVAVSPDGNRVVSASWDKTLKVWDVKTGAELATLMGHIVEVKFCAITPDGRRIVSVSNYDTRIWDMETSAELATLDKHTAYEKFCAITPDGKLIVSTSSDKTLKIWDMDTGAELTTLKGHKGAVNSCAISPDGKLIVSTSSDKTLKIWDMDTGLELATLNGHTDDVDSCAISPDGKLIVSISSDKTLKIWDIETGAELTTLKGHKGAVNSCAISPDGKRIVSASRDKTLKVWDMKTGVELATLRGHTDDVNSCAVSPDGKRIVSASSDNTLMVWDMETGIILSIFISFGNCYTVKSICGGGFVVGDSIGQVYVLKHIGDITTGAPFVTFVRIWDSENRQWDKGVTARCQWCGNLFTHSIAVTDAIVDIARSAGPSLSVSPALKLHLQAWEDTRLLYECPHCHNPLRYNSFIVDNRDRVLKYPSRVVNTIVMPIPHSGANPDIAAQINKQYQYELTKWKSLPWWKRLKVKKPEKPHGI